MQPATTTTSNNQPATMNNIYPSPITPRSDKEKFLNQRAKVIWLTGLSGSGKTTIASRLEEKLFSLGYFCQVLDGDNVRAGISKNLGFTTADRIENIRRIAEVSRLFMNCGIILICAFISPAKAMRQLARDIIGPADFLEIYVNTPLDVCEKRDPKGLYKKARAGEIQNFTGVSASFEEPVNPFLEVDNTNPNVAETIERIVNKVLPEIQYK
jgi:adenylylsulfate kinase